MLSKKKRYAVRKPSTGKYLRTDEKGFGPLDCIDSALYATRLEAEVAVFMEETSAPRTKFEIVEVQLNRI
jgi:hypothetical protein